MTNKTVYVASLESRVDSADNAMTDETSARAARDAYDDALEKACAASGKAAQAAGTDAYNDASAAFITAYAELNYARCAYAAALDAGCPTTTTEENV